MAINPRGYQEVSQRGYYGEGGKEGKAAITLLFNNIHLFKYIKEVSHKCDLMGQNQSHVAFFSYGVE